MADEQELDLSMLSQEERDALAFLGADDDSDAPIGTITDTPQTITMQQQDAQAPATPQADAAPPADVAAAAVAQQAAAPVPAAQPQQEQQQAIPQAAPAFPKFKTPANADALRAQYEEKEAALAQSFDDGELTASEFRTQLREVQKAQRELDQQMMMAQISERATQETYANAVTTFLAQNQQYQPNTREYAFLDAELKRLQTEASAAGHDARNPALLHQAHATISQLLGGAQPQPTPAPTPGLQQQAAPTPQSKLPPAPGHVIPPAFHQIPTASNTEIGDPVANALAGLSGEEFEAAFNRMPVDAREAFLSRMN